MKRGALFGKKFLRNAVIALAVIAVAYVVMRGVKEGFQAGGNTKEYPFNIVYNAQTGSSTTGTYQVVNRILNIPRADYEGKTIKNIRMMSYGPATQKYTKTLDASKRNAMNKWDVVELTGPGEREPIDRNNYAINFTSEIVTKDSKGKPTSRIYTLRGPNYLNNTNVKKLGDFDIFLGNIDAATKLTVADKSKAKANVNLFNSSSQGIKVNGLEQGPANIDMNATGDRLSEDKDNVKFILDFA